MTSSVDELIASVADKALITAVVFDPTTTGFQSHLELNPAALPEEFRGGPVGIWLLLLQAEMMLLTRVTESLTQLMEAGPLALQEYVAPSAAGGGPNSAGEAPNGLVD